GAMVQIWLAPRLKVPQLIVRFTLAPARLMPLLMVKVVLPWISTGADGLLITMPLQVAALAKVLEQLGGAATVASQMALSVPPGATPLTQLDPRFKLLLLFALVWSAEADVISARVATPASNRRRNESKMVDSITLSQFFGAGDSLRLIALSNERAVI